MNLDEALAQTTHRVLLYGLSSTGKTELAGRAAEFFDRVYFFSLEKGHTTLAKLPANVKAKIELFQIPDTRNHPVGHELISKVLEGKEVKFCQAHGKTGCLSCEKEGKPFETFNLSTLGKGDLVVIDSLTQLTSSCMARITKGKPIDYKPERDDWGSLSFHMGNVASGLQQCPANLICISHLTESAEDAVQELYIPVFGSRTSSLNIARCFDHVVYMQVKDKKHKAISSTTAMNGLVAKSRTDTDFASDPLVALKEIFGR